MSQLREIVVFIIQILARSLHVFFGVGACCRFEPTCSQYAVRVIRELGVIEGSWLTVKRLVRCSPFGGSGVDPVPVKG